MMMPMIIMTEGDNKFSLHSVALMFTVMMMRRRRRRMQKEDDNKLTSDPVAFVTTLH